MEIKCDNESKIALKRARHTDTYLHIAEAPGPSTWRFLVGSFLHEGKNELVIWQQVLLFPVNTLVQDRLVHWVKVKTDNWLLNPETNGKDMCLSFPRCQLNPSLVCHMSSYTELCQTKGVLVKCFCFVLFFLTLEK